MRVQRLRPYGCPAFGLFERLFVIDVDPAELADPEVLLIYLAGNATRDR